MFTLISFCRWFPILSTYYGQAYLSFFVNIWMINFSFETNFWWLEWILSRKSDFNFKCTLIVRWVVLINWEKTIFEWIMKTKKVQNLPALSYHSKPKCLLHLQWYLWKISSLMLLCQRVPVTDNIKNVKIFSHLWILRYCSVNVNHFYIQYTYRIGTIKLKQIKISFNYLK